FSLVGDGRRRKPARGDVERHVPPMVHVRAERQPHFADDLGPHVQRGAGGLPGCERQRRPVWILLVHPRAPFPRLASAYFPRQRGFSSRTRQPAKGCDEPVDVFSSSFYTCGLIRTRPTRGATFSATLGFDINPAALGHRRRVALL